MGRAVIADLLTAIAIGNRQDGELPFTADRAFAITDDVTGVDVPDLIRRCDTGDELTDEEL